MIAVKIKTVMSLGMMGLILVSCKSVAQQNPAASTSVAESPPQAKKEVRPLAGPQPKSNPAITGIAPNRCRIIGKIVAVSSERDKDNTSVCGKAPCKAIVKIQQVIGYGHAFTQTLAANQEINTYFTFSLSPTAKLFPDMTTPLPGLAIGSIFEADVAYNSEVAGDVAPWYQVGVYRLAR